MEERPVVALRIVSSCETAEQFIATFSRYCDEKSLFIATTTPKPCGERIRFTLTLAGGNPVLTGVGEVDETHATKQNPYGRPGMRIRFERLDDQSRKWVRVLTSERAKKLSQGDPKARFALPTTLPRKPGETAKPGAAALAAAKSRPPETPPPRGKQRVTTTTRDRSRTRLGLQANGIMPARTKVMEPRRPLPAPPPPKRAPIATPRPELLVPPPVPLAIRPEQSDGIPEEDLADQETGVVLPLNPLGRLDDDSIGVMVDCFLCEVKPVDDITFDEDTDVLSPAAFLAQLEEEEFGISSSGTHPIDPAVTAERRAAASARVKAKDFIDDEETVVPGVGPKALAKVPLARAPAAEPRSKPAPAKAKAAPKPPAAAKPPATPAARGKAADDIVTKVQAAASANADPAVFDLAMRAITELDIEGDLVDDDDSEDNDELTEPVDPYQPVRGDVAALFDAVTFGTTVRASDPNPDTIVDSGPISVFGTPIVTATEPAAALTEKVEAPPPPPVEPKPARRRGALVAAIALFVLVIACGAGGVVWMRLQQLDKVPIDPAAGAPAALEELEVPGMAEAIEAELEREPAIERHDAPEVIDVGAVESTGAVESAPIAPAVESATPDAGQPAATGPDAGAAVVPAPTQPAAPPAEVKPAAAPPAVEAAAEPPADKQKPEPKQKPCSTRITSNPPRAAVTLDGTTIGLTPVVRVIPCGRHTVSLRLDGHDSKSRRVRARPGRVERVSISLSAKPAPAKAEPPPGMKIDLSRLGD